MQLRRTTRSPLSAKPLRIAGQSLGEEIWNVSYDGVLSPLLLAMFMLLLAGLEWWQFETHRPPSPWLFTICALGTCVYAAVRVVWTMRRLRDLSLGCDGERAVAQYLEWFRTAGYFVLHDVPSQNANIDHVLIGAHGIFTIETKTHSKPARGDCKIQVIAGQVFANNHLIKRNPIVQAKAQARWLLNFMSEAQFKVFVQPVVVFPGWFVEPFNMKSEGVWVLEPKALDKFLEREPERFSKDQIKAMASALSSYVRSKSSL